MNSEISRQIPSDFPRDQGLASVSGYHPKVALRQVDGKYISGLTDEEWHERYDACLDLVVQLTAYCQRKHHEHPEWTSATLLNKVRQGIGAKGWDLTSAELDWIMSHVSEELGWAARSN